MKNRNAIVRSRMSRAFTLIELLLVLVILGVLAAVVVPRLANRAKDAKLTKAHTDVSNIGFVIDTFEVDNSRYPSTDEGLRALMEAPNNCPNWKGPYLKTWPVDPWGADYVYRYPGTHNPDGYDLYSVGEDGQEGTGDDIGNWAAGQ
jgi:general secretion pathway protein G